MAITYRHTPDGGVLIARDADPVSLIPVSTTHAPAGSAEWAAALASGTTILNALPVAEQFASLTLAQLRKALRQAGYTKAQLATALTAAYPAGPGRDLAEIELEYLNAAERGNATVAAVLTALGLTSVQIDALWRAAAVL